MLVVGAVLALTTSVRVYVWQDEIRLWVEATRESPQKPRPWINLGRHAHAAKRYEDAAAAYRYAATLAERQHTPEGRLARAYAEHNLAAAYLATGRVSDARTVLTPLLAREPSFRHAAILATTLPPEPK